jgi:membrane peptidoglycan carboxypeptidase
MDNGTINARMLRLSVVKNVYKGGYITESEAKELLTLPLNPEKPETAVDDSALLNDPDALRKIEAELRAMKEGVE